LRLMRRARFMIALSLFVATLLTVAPAAFARADGGQGWWGETNDKDITNVMFLTIAFFPVVIIVLTIIQWRLDKRKHAKLDAAKRRAANADWRGGW
jgi:heme/copper-type cytochrome/quinol oxidase subunit 2